MTAARRTAASGFARSNLATAIRSDFRSRLREHFEVNRHYIVVAALKALADEGTVPLSKVAEAIARYGIDAAKINPLYA